MRSAEREDLNAARRSVLEALRLGPPPDVQALVAAVRRLSLDPSRGTVALCADAPADLALPGSLLLARMRDGRVLGLVAEARAQELAELLRTRVAASAPRRDPSLLHDALAEAELLLELPDSGDEDTYRLLIGVLLRDPEELELLVRGTIAPIAAYDERHATELLATLECFLAHHGSTTEAAEAMNLHRHTIGYRLARAHEVSGLSPHESAGRERLSLGLKAKQILEACRRRMSRL
jgi:PucR family transcriptional regulator, purine catabolism regulatory protein